jgi:hypothetical protein
MLLVSLHMSDVLNGQKATDHNFLPQSSLALAWSWLGSIVFWLECHKGESSANKKLFHFDNHDLAIIFNHPFEYM